MPDLFRIRKVGGRRQVFVELFDNNRVLVSPSREDLDGSELFWLDYTALTRAEARSRRTARGRTQVRAGTTGRIGASRRSGGAARACAATVGNGSDATPIVWSDGREVVDFVVPTHEEVLSPIFHEQKDSHTRRTEPTGSGHPHITRLAARSGLERRPSWPASEDGEGRRHPAAATIRPTSLGGRGCPAARG